MRWLQLSLTLIRFSEEPRKSSYTFLTIYEGSSCETFQGCCRIKCHPHPVEGPFTYPGTKVPGTLEDLGPDGDGRPECDAPQSGIIYNTPELILPARCDTSVCLSENGLSEILRTRTAQHKLFVPPKEDQNRRGCVWCPRSGQITTQRTLWQTQVHPGLHIRYLIAHWTNKEVFGFSQFAKCTSSCDTLNAWSWSLCFDSQE